MTEMPRWSWYVDVVHVTIARERKAVQRGAIIFLPQGFREITDQIVATTIEKREAK